jgi:hypothetical protein
MKKYLFIDNYRGFCKTTVPLADVNFMVGENSTGKTSLLGLLRILSSPSLFMGPGFGVGDEVQFGHFNEVVSAHASDRSYFTIGLVEELAPPAKRGPSVLSRILLTYKNASGIPTLSRLTFSAGNNKIGLHIKGDVITFKSTSFNGASPAEDVTSLFERWSEDHATESSHWTKLEIPKGVPSRIDPFPIYVLMHWAVDQSNIKHSPDFSFRFAGFSNSLVWIAPIRTKPRRTYDEPNTTYSSEGSHTPYVIRRMLGSSHEAKVFKGFMDRVGSASGLFQSIDIKRFGNSDDAPFEVDAVLDDKALNLSWLGYGVSQSLPIFVELLDRPRNTWFAIQQPEVHLHPRAQATLGDVFFEMALRDAKRFVIETHSDFTIDRFRMNYRRKHTKQSRLPQSQVLFFQRENARNTVTPLPIGPHGELPPDQPKGYRDFFIKEELQLLDV